MIVIPSGTDAPIYHWPYATVAMILMEPASGLMQVAPLPALNREFTSYRLEIDEIGRAAFERSAAAGAA